MGQVLVLLRVFPEEVETPLDDLRQRIEKSLPEGYELKAWDEEPIAFGIKALRLLVVMPEDVEGGTETLENTVSQVPGVSQVEVITVHRV